MLLSIVWGAREVFQAFRLSSLEELLQKELVTTSGHASFSSRSGRILAEKELSLLQGDSSETDVLHVCQALSHLADAYSSDPSQALVLAQWTRLRASLGQYQCDIGGTAVHDMCPFSQDCTLFDLVLHALQMNPLDVDVLFETGWAQVLIGYTPRGYGTWKHLLEMIRPSPFQEEVILSHLNSLEDVSLVAPERFPNLIYLLDRYVRSTEGDVIGRFDDMLLESLQHWQESSHFIDPQTEHWIWKSYPSIGNDAVRKSFDRVLSQYFRQSQSLASANYFDYRSSLSRLPSVTGCVYQDSNPETATLWSWNSRNFFSLDGYDRSVGCFVPTGSEVVLLEIEAPRTKDPFPFEHLRLYQSEDNVRWGEVKPENVVSFDVSPTQQMVSFYLAPLRAKFLKVTYQDGPRGDLFRNSLSQMLHIYGQFEVEA